MARCMRVSKRKASLPMAIQFTAPLPRDIIISKRKDASSTNNKIIIISKQQQLTMEYMTERRHSSQRRGGELGLQVGVAVAVATLASNLPWVNAADHFVLP